MTNFLKGTKPMIDIFKREKEKIKVVNIPLGQIRPNPNQPRKNFDTAGLEELSASIAQNGVLQPISVRKTMNCYEIVAGERRYRASVMAGLTKIPAIVMEADEKKSALFALLENLQREDLSFFEIAQGYQRLLRDQGITQEELARKLGKSQSTVANKLRLLRFTPRVQMLISDYSLTERHARALLHLSSEDMQCIAAQTIYEQQLNVKQAEELIKEMLNSKPTQNRRVKISAYHDMRMFTNTIKQAIDIMRENGVQADMSEKSFEWGTEYVIKVKKKSKEVVDWE